VFVYKILDIKNGSVRHPQHYKARRAPQRTGSDTVGRPASHIKMKITNSHNILESFHQ
jgi:hypothetical protein